MLRSWHITQAIEAIAKRASAKSTSSFPRIDVPCLNIRYQPLISITPLPLLSSIITISQDQKEPRTPRTGLKSSWPCFELSVDVVLLITLNKDRTLWKELLGLEFNSLVPKEIVTVPRSWTYLCLSRPVPPIQTSRYLDGERRWGLRHLVGAGRKSNEIRRGERRKTKR